MLDRICKGFLPVLLACVVAGQAAAAAPEAPRMLIVVGQRIIAIDEARSFWVRGLGAQDSWSRIEFAGPARDALAYGGVCAQDNSGVCLFTVIRDGAISNVLYDTATGREEILALDGAESSILANRTDLYVVKPGSGGGKDLYLYKTDAKTSTLAGTLAPTEIVTYLAVDGTLRPIALDSSLKARTLEGGGKSTPVNMPYSDQMVLSKGEMLLPEGWGNEKPVVPGLQSLSRVHLESTAAATPMIIAKGGVIVASAPDKSAYVPGMVRSDANRDVVAEVVSPQGRFVGLLCNVGTGRGFGTFVRVGIDSSVDISGSDWGPGFIVRIGDALTTGTYRYLSFPPAGGFSDRKCENLKFSNIDLGITPRSIATEFEKSVGAATSADGAKIPYFVLKPKGRAPKTLIIHVYGAYGRMVSPEPYHENVLKAVREHDTAVVMPVVRGDGNLGYAHGVASRPPNRMKAVEDVIAVAESLAVEFPGLKPIVRGGSAGGWLAVRAALERPDLFSGVVSVSGAYTVSGLKAVSGSDERFFSPEDDLSLLADRLKTVCPGLRMRLIHARDDWKLPYADAVKFAEQVKAAGCPVEFVTFDTGGHNIDIPIDQVADGLRMTNAFYGPFAP
jgi:pimeloyl-ACP methyl ester carboxylesterase